MSGDDSMDGGGRAKQGAVAEPRLKGEAEMSCRHLTCLHAAERPDMDVRAGAERSRLGCAMEGMHGGY